MTDIAADAADLPALRPEDDDPVVGLCDSSGWFVELAQSEDGC
jgi:hypothetical protein